MTRKMAHRKVTASKRMPPKVGPAQTDEEAESKCYVLSHPQKLRRQRQRSKDRTQVRTYQLCPEIQPWWQICGHLRSRRRQRHQGQTRGWTCQRLWNQDSSWKGGIWMDLGMGQWVKQSHADVWRKSIAIELIKIVFSFSFCEVYPVCGLHWKVKYEFASKAPH